MRVAFVIYGRPQPQGSTRAFIPKGGKRPIITTDNKKLKPWRQQVSAVALEETARVQQGLIQPIPREIAVSVKLEFFLARPASLPHRFYSAHQKTRCRQAGAGNARRLTGTAITDDSQVVMLFAKKRYGQPERVEITIATAHDAELIENEGQRAIEWTDSPALVPA